MFHLRPAARALLGHLEGDFTAGAPLADVQRAQARDVREAGRGAVMEAGGKKEIAMMVPVVFLVLPVTVLFAVYPGFSFLRFSL